MNYKLNDNCFQFVKLTNGKIEDGVLDLGGRRRFMRESSLFVSSSYDVVLIGKVCSYDHLNVWVCFVDGRLYYINLCTSVCYIYNMCDDDLDYVIGLISSL